MDSVTPSTTVYLASFAALLGALAMGLALGYSAPAFVKMETDLCPNNNCDGVQGNTSSIFSADQNEKEKEKSLIGSMLAVGALVGGLLAEPANKILGRRLSLISFGIPFTLGWILIGMANGYKTIVVGRLLTGLCCGLVSCTAPTYVVEISPPSIRGMLGTCFQVMVTIGILLSAIFGVFMSWQLMAWISILAGAGMSILMFGMPETPQWLLTKNRQTEAEQQLKRLRSGQTNEEFNMMTQAANQAREQTASQYSWETIKKREFTKPLTLALALMFFQQFSGINAILFYQTDIFKKAAPKLDASLATILVCVAQVVATVGGSLLVDRLGRRILLIASGVGHAVSLVTFGWYSYMGADNADFSVSYAWLAVTSLIVFIISFSVGYGPIPWMMIPELSSTSVRSLVASIATAFNWTCVYIVTGYVKSLMNSIGDSNAYYLFGSICILSCAFVVFVLPETKGRSNEQIQVELLGTRPPKEDTNLRPFA